VTGRVLLDTHSFLWWVSQNGAQLSPAARDVIGSDLIEIMISVVSTWEIAIKASSGRLDLQEPVGRFVPRRIRRHDLRVLNVTLEHTLRVAELPMIHRDPFDRLLIAQAQVERLPIVTNDPAISRYDVETIW
jgi:PIN domain nuclease of toxin-antitoxin system